MRICPHIEKKGETDQSMQVAPLFLLMTGSDYVEREVKGALTLKNKNCEMQGSSK